ncbi:MAG: NUDIX pyrophosphatase [Desulfuromonadaceae bacterium]|jgi:8-oxo-dGTP pyrophosphatase MutT (NUDIX family)|nr:NUDIX pyrophosphatase [Desulfuromonas sp.]MDY0185491.1 NUDIX pyrophosphatase [Desulfuromonadaceae bacterium]
MEITEVVTGFLRHAGKILLLQRSAQVGTYRGCWAAVSGHLEGESPLAHMLVEIAEETTLRADQVVLRAQGTVLEIADHNIGRHWRIYPFLFDVLTQERIRTDWEHSDWRWVDIEEIGRYATVPRLREALDSCLALEDEQRET